MLCRIMLYYVARRLVSTGRARARPRRRGRDRNRKTWSARKGLEGDGCPHTSDSSQGGRMRGKDLEREKRSPTRFTPISIQILPQKTPRRVNNNIYDNNTVGETATARLGSREQDLPANNHNDSYANSKGLKRTVCIVRKGGRCGWKPSSSSHFSI